MKKIASLLFIMLVSITFCGCKKQKFDDLTQELKSQSFNTDFMMTKSSISNAWTMADIKSELSKISSNAELAQVLINQMMAKPAQNIVSNEAKQFSVIDFSLYPSFFDANNVIYAVINYQKDCPNMDIENPKNSSCVIEFDVNYVDEPNKIGVDRGYLIYSSNDKKFVFDKISQESYEL